MHAGKRILLFAAALVLAVSSCAASALAREDTDAHADGAPSDAIMQEIVCRLDDVIAERFLPVRGAAVLKQIYCALPALSEQLPELGHAEFYRDMDPSAFARLDNGPVTTASLSEYFAAHPLQISGPEQLQNQVNRTVDCLIQALKNFSVQLGNLFSGMGTLPLGEAAGMLCGLIPSIRPAAEGLDRICTALGTGEEKPLFDSLSAGDLDAPGRALKQFIREFLRAPAQSGLTLLRLSCGPEDSLYAVLIEWIGSQLPALLRDFQPYTAVDLEGAAAALEAIGAFLNPYVRPDGSLDPNSLINNVLIETIGNGVSAPIWLQTDGPVPDGVELILPPLPQDGLASGTSAADTAHTLFHYLYRNILSDPKSCAVAADLLPQGGAWGLGLSVLLAHGPELTEAEAAELTVRWLSGEPLFPEGSDLEENGEPDTGAPSAEPGGDLGGSPAAAGQGSVSAGGDSRVNPRTGDRLPSSVFPLGFGAAAALILLRLRGKRRCP